MIKLDNDVIYCQTIKAMNTYRLVQVFGIIDGSIEDITLQVIRNTKLRSKGEYIKLTGSGYNAAQDICENLNNNLNVSFYNYKTLDGIK